MTGGGDAPHEFVAFVDATMPALLRTARLLDAAYAEDLVQETYERLAEHWSRVDAGTAHAYARRVLYHRAVDGWRSAWRRRESATEVLVEPRGAGSTESSDDRVALAAALAQLPAKQRAVIVLRFYEDLTERQAADVLGCSANTVKTHQRRALATLRGLAPALLSDEETATRVGTAGEELR